MDVRKRIVTEKMSEKMGERHMDYFAHIDGERKQSVLEHSEGVARLAGMFAGEFGKYEWGYCSGLLHDIGKYSLRFQRIRAFAEFARRYGVEELEKCLLRNKEKGIVYHYEGQLVGDYDKCQTEEEIIEMIKTGK